MTQLYASCGEGGLAVTGVCTRCGNDLCICLCGGKEHIGAVAFAQARPSLSGSGVSASASVLCGLGHKEDPLVREAALRFSSAFGCNVCVTAGLHIDRAEAGEIQAFLQNSAAVLDQLEQLLSHEKNV